MSKYLKEIIFGILFFIVVVLIIGIVFYEFIPNQLIPEANKYDRSADTTKLLSHIEEEKQEEQSDNKSDVLKSYELSAEDLSSYDKAQYEKGKNHPFFDYTSVTSETTSTPGETTSSTSSTSVSGSVSSSGSQTGSSASNKTIDTSSLRDTSDSTRTSK